MIGNIGGITGIVISIFMIVLFVIGLWNSKRNSFNGGVFFFLLLIINQVYSFVAPPLIRNYIDTFSIGNKDPMFGITLGELVLLFSLIPKLILLTAFICLIYGLQRLWKFKSISPE